MKGKKLPVLIVVSVIICLLIIITLTSEVSFNAAPSIIEQHPEEYNCWNVSNKEDIVVDVKGSDGKSILLRPEEPVEFEVDIPEDGEYKLLLNYKTIEEVLIKSTLLAEVNEQSCRTLIYSLWADESKEYLKDRYGNELPAKQVCLDLPVSEFVKDQSGVCQLPYIFNLKSGTATLVLTSDDVELNLHSAALVKNTEIPSYEEYFSKYKQYRDGTDLRIIEGEGYIAKSDSYIRARGEINPALYPYDTYTKKLNVLDYDSFYNAGQKVMYEFDIKTSGIYYISFRYSQNYKEDIPTYSNIFIDSEILCKTFQNVPYSYTGLNYANTTVSNDGMPVGIYLEQGAHTLTLELDGTLVSGLINDLKEALKEISDLGLEIRKVSGTGVSEFRTWDVDDYLPGVKNKLEGYREKFLDIYKELGKLQKEDPVAALNLKLAADNIDKILKQPNKLPGKLHLLSEGSGSAAQYLSELIDKLIYQPLSIDRIYIHGYDYDIPNASAGFFTGIGESIKKLGNSIFSSKDSVGSNNDDETIKISVNRPIHMVEMLQAMIDTEFTPKTGIKVDLTVMASEQKIILNNAANNSPDIIMGVGTQVPYDLGIRGAAADLMQFEDFSSFIQKEYNINTLNQYVSGDKVFGVTETQEFYVLLARTDILKSLNLTMPQTWDDVAAMMPVLRRNSMNFYLQLSGYSGTKPLFTTIPFFMQAGSSLFSEDGRYTSINSIEGLEGFETLTDLYRLYSVQPVVSSFYSSFRFGQIPIGVCSFSDYIRIKNAAPEIAGLWEVALLPGTATDDGEIKRGTNAAQFACAIMESSQKKDECWEFLKWWLLSQTQIDFGYNLQVLYGSDYLWNTANVEAFKQLSIAEKDKKVILEQWDQMAEINRHPALYAIEREISTAWIDVVLNGESARIALDKAALNINREFERKLREFESLEFNRTIEEILGTEREEDK